MVVRWGDTNISQLLILRPCWLQLWHFCSRPLILDVMDNVSNPTCSADVKMTKKKADRGKTNGFIHMKITIHNCCKTLL